MSDAPGMDAAPTIGRQLAQLREARGLDVAKVAEELRCDRALIEALEADRYADLGAAVFARGHLRRYADHLGAPTEALLARWSTEQGAAQALPDLTRAPQAPRPIDTRRWGRVLARIAGALAIGLAAWWILQGAGLRRPDASSATTPAASVAQAVPVPRASAPIAAAPVTAEPIAAAPVAPAAVAAPPVAAPVADAPAVTAPPPAAPGELALAFTTAADCWAEVTDARGSRRLYQIIRAGERVTTAGAPPLRVTLGRGDVTRLEIGGRPAAIPADAVRDAVARFEVAASGAMRALPPVPDPSAAAPEPR